MQIDLTAAVEIASDAPSVFAWFSDYRNDPYWRKEVRAVTLSTGSIEQGSLITEVSFLSNRVPEYVSCLRCIAFSGGKSIVSETTAESKFWARNSRSVEPLPGSRTRVIYQLQFDTAVVRHGLGFSLPVFIVKFYTRMTMKKYLAVLKKNLEQLKPVPVAEMR
jgi:hypothetical protein